MRPCCPLNHYILNRLVNKQPCLNTQICSKRIKKATEKAFLPSEKLNDPFIEDNATLPHIWPSRTPSPLWEANVIMPQYRAREIMYGFIRRYHRLYLNPESAPMIWIVVKVLIMGKTKHWNWDMVLKCHHKLCFTPRSPSAVSVFVKVFIVDWNYASEVRCPMDVWTSYEYVLRPGTEYVVLPCAQVFSSGVQWAMIPMSVHPSSGINCKTYLTQR